MMQKIGFFTMCIGGMCADSECLLIPIIITGIGALMIYFGEDF